MALTKFWPTLFTAAMKIVKKTKEDYGVDLMAPVMGAGNKKGSTLLFSDYCLDNGVHCTVAPAKRSTKAVEKINSKRLEDGSVAHSFQSLLRNLATIVRNTCQKQGMDPKMPAFTVDTQHSKKQQEAFQLLQNIKM